MPVALSPMLEFLHGLAFFVLGLFILFAIPRIGRANIAWPLPLLALFALGEAMTAWDPVLAAAFGLPAAAQTQLARVLQSLNQTIQDIRRYIFNLQGGLPPSDLVSGLEELLRDFRINTLLETRLTVSGEEREALGAEQRQHILQIAREALANVARHAHARRVDVRLTYDTRTLQLQIADDGVGLAMTPPATGQGLRNIRERARLLDGTLDIDSAFVSLCEIYEINITRRHKDTKKMTCHEGHKVTHKGYKGAKISSFVPFVWPSCPLWPFKI